MQILRISPFSIVLLANKTKEISHETLATTTISVSLWDMDDSRGTMGAPKDLYDERQPVRAASHHIQQGLPVHPGSPNTLVCYEKFERIETSQFQNCFTKHDFLYRESIEITTSVS